MEESKFLAERKRGWVEARKYFESKGAVYTEADNYFEKHFGENSFDVQYFRCLMDKCGSANDNRRTFPSAHCTKLMTKGREHRE